MTDLKSFWVVECLTCSARFTSKVWEVLPLGFCPQCSKSYPNNKEYFKFLEKYKDFEI